MSFVQTMVALAAGFAAAKGYDKYREMGGMEGVKKALDSHPALANNPTAKQMLERASSLAAKGSEAAAAGMSRLTAMLGGAAATGSTEVAAMIDALTGGKAASAAVEDNAKLMIRAMIMAAKADGVIDAAEREQIEAHLADASPAERAFVAAEMDKPVDVLALARDVEGAAKSQVYSAAAGMCRGDTEAEQQFLAALGGALQLDLATRRMLHASLGIAAPSV